MFIGKKWENQSLKLESLNDRQDANPGGSALRVLRFMHITQIFNLNIHTLPMNNAQAFNS